VRCLRPRAGAVVAELAEHPGAAAPHGTATSTARCRRFTWPPEARLQLAGRQSTFSSAPFETGISVGRQARYLAVAGHDAADRELGRSDVHRL
jgi:hypothetical protein